MKDKIIGYLWEVACGLSVFFNTVCGGSHKSTTSNRLRSVKLKHAGIIPWSKPISKISIWVVDIVVSDHLKQPKADDK